MSNLDLISDLLTRIRNANHISAKDVVTPSSNLNQSICEVMKKEGYIKSYYVRADEENKKKNYLIVEMKYISAKEKVIHGIKLISTSGRRVYVSKSEIPYVMGGYGIAILTTSKGIISDREARKAGIGGEVICYVW